ncbi:MAG: hypothetical protein AAF213_03015 [Pseudomonadota bacterium]
MPIITIEFDEEDWEALTRAAKIAERSVAEFMAEEAMDLADLINISDDLRHVTLARHRAAENKEFFKHFNKSGRASGPVEEWGRRQQRKEQERKDRELKDRELKNRALNNERD